MGSSRLLLGSWCQSVLASDPEIQPLGPTVLTCIFPNPRHKTVHMQFAAAFICSLLQLSILLEIFPKPLYVTHVHLSRTKYCKIRIIKYCPKAISMSLHRLLNRYSFSVLLYQCAGVNVRFSERTMRELLQVGGEPAPQGSLLWVGVEVCVF